MTLGAEEGVGREEEGGGGRSNRSIGHVIGGPCETECRIPHTICNAESQICECDPHFPILLHDTICTRRKCVSFVKLLTIIAWLAFRSYCNLCAAIEIISSCMID